MISEWEIGWKCLFDALSSVTMQNCSRVVKIRDEEHTITEALNRQLGHYANHIGQIVMLGKMIRGEEWVSLSIPRGGTEAFNKKMFGK